MKHIILHLSEKEFYRILRIKNYLANHLNKKLTWEDFMAQIKFKLMKGGKK